MSDFKKYLGFIWASPVSVVGLLYVSLFTLMGWYRFYRILDNCLIWVVDSESSPSFLVSTWQKWNGQTLGNIIVLRQKPKDERSASVTHQIRHVEQYMRLGIFLPAAYLICHLIIKLGCVEVNARYDNPFEIDARRAADQIIDISGMMKRLKESKKGRK